MTIRCRATMIATMLAKQRGSNKLRPGLFDLPEMPAGLRRLHLLDTLLVLFAVLPAAAADEPKVTIEGGVLPDNRQFFEWTVANQHTAPIVFIEFPHYHADTFVAPAGWAQDWKNRTMAGGKDAPGWVRTSVGDPAQGIPSGGSARFKMRLALVGALPRPGKVTVRFADETEATIANVELPTAQSFLERNAMLIGLAAILVIALLLHLRRRRTRLRAAATAPPSVNEQ